MTYEKHPQRGKATKEAIATIPEYECEPDKLSKCPSCLCMTKTIKGYCGKCNFKKDAMPAEQTNSWTPIPCASCGRLIYRGQTIRSIHGKEIHSGCPVPTTEAKGKKELLCIITKVCRSNKPIAVVKLHPTQTLAPAKSVSPAREEQPATDCACKGRHDRHCIFYKEPQCPLPATEEEKNLIIIILYRGYSSSAPTPSEKTREECLQLLRTHVQREVEAARKVMQIEIEGEIRIAIMETHDKIIAQQAVEKAMVDMRNNLWARHLEIRERIDRTKTLRPTEKNRLAGFADGLWGAVREIDSRYPNAKKVKP